MNLLLDTRPLVCFLKSKIYLKTNAKSYAIFNQLGEKIVEGKTSINNDTAIDLSHLQPGIYLIKTYAENSKILNQHKFIKI